MMRLMTIAIFVLFGLYGCATPGAPQGGPQDKDAPIVKVYNPELLSTQFKEKSIEISFDEWIIVQNLKQNLIISPPVNPEPNIFAKKNQLNIQFKGDLKENTTYSIFFGDAVRDNNEGNIIPNLSYVFSTGEQLDSLKIQGRLKTLDGSPIPENTFVQLYKYADDSIITRERPSYIYKINKEGLFEINYLPSDTFQLFALNDLNTNYLYDLPTEWIGKYPEPIYLDSTVTSLEIPIILPEAEDVKIVQYNSTLENDILNLEFNKEINLQNDSIFLQNLSTGKIYPFYSNFTNKKFQYFVLSDSLSMNCVVSINSNILDTIRVRKASKPSENLIFRPIDQVIHKDSILSAFDNEHFSLISNIPILNVDLQKIFFIADSDTFSISKYEIVQQEFGLKLSYPLSSNQKGFLYFQDSSILFANQQYLDSTSFRLDYVSSSLFGNLSFDIILPSIDTSYIIRLFHKNGLLLDEVYSKGDTILNYNLPPFKEGEFFVEVIEDINDSGTWNGASFWNFRAPERVFISSSYAVKPNWEDTQTIQVSFDKAQLPTKSLSLLDLILSTKNSVNQSVNPNQSPIQNMSNSNNSTFSTPRQSSMPDLKRR